MREQTVSQDLAVDFRTLFQSAPSLCLVLDPEFTIVAVSDTYLRATMTERSKIQGRGLFEVFPDNPDDPNADGVKNLRTSLERVLKKKVADSMPIQKYDIRRPEEEGGTFEVRYWRPLNTPILNSRKEVSYIIHQVEDVTDLVHLKQVGAEQDAVNRKLETRAAQMESEVHLRVQQLQKSNSLLEHANEELARLSESLEERVAERTVQLADANSRLENELEERERLKQQFMQSQKMEAVGRLAGGVAHDFNNLLTVIQGYTQLLLTEKDPASSEREQLMEITQAADRAAALTKQLLAFSRQQIMEIKVLDVNVIVAEMGKMLDRLIGEDIDLVVIAGAALGRVKADASQLGQVILNLSVNARDAMPDGGKLTIETANVELDETYTQNHLNVTPGPYVMLAVSDTGAGMDKKTQERIFEPFFTTKELGKGTGLGLSTVYGIVKQSGGNIWVYSEIGQGTTFKVYLPRINDAATPAEKSDAGKTLAGKETVLLVEDEEAVRNLIRTALKARGYNVLIAQSGAEALNIIQENPVIDLMLTDVVMPEMSGRDLAEAVAIAAPAAKVLYMSGYTGESVIRHGVTDPANHFIQKPFRPVDLLRKVREVLDGPENGNS